MNGIQSGITIPGQNRPESYGNEGVRYIPQRSTTGDQIQFIVKQDILVQSAWIVEYTDRFSAKG